MAQSEGGLSLHRVLSPLGVVFLTFSALSPVMSVYIAGDTLLHIAGTGAALAVVIGGVVSALVALGYAELGAAFPGAGGVYPSISAVLGRFITFPMVVLFLPVVVASTAFTALGLGDYVRVLIPGIPAGPIVVAGVLVASLIAILNVRLGARVTGIFLTVEAVALMLLAGVAAVHPVRSLGEVLAHPVMLNHGVLVATPLAVLGLGLSTGAWITAGANYALYFAEELNAPRQIGRVIAWTGFIAAIIGATPIVLMTTSTVDIRAMLGAEAPMAAFLTATAGPTLTAVISVGVVAALFNCLIATIMIFARFLYATGRDGLWAGPVNRLLATLHPRTRTPWAATLVLSGLALLTCLIGERAILILISGDVFTGALMAISLFISRPRGQTGRWFKTPLHPLIPAISLAFAFVTVVVDWLDVDAGRPSILLLGGLFLFGLIYYRLRLRRAGQAWRIGGVDLDLDAVHAGPLGADLLA